MTTTIFRGGRAVGRTDLMLTQLALMLELGFVVDATRPGVFLVEQGQALA